MNKKKLGIIIVAVFALTVFIKLELSYNPSLRILSSVINFSESTLKDPNYLAYNIDLKDLFRNYANADIEYSGSAYIKRVKGFPYSINGQINGQRSADQKKFSCESNLNVLVLDVGEFNIYAHDKTVYFMAPLLGDISYGFETEENLFPKAPDLSHDINHEWFHNNKRNILHFVNSIKITETDNVFVDDDGSESTELKITIPQGEGDFIWELLGMEAPDHDMNCSMFLDKHNHTHKIVFDLSFKREGSYVEISGKNFSKITIYSPLPDKEEIIATIERDGNNNYTNSFINNLTYTTNARQTYSVDCNVFLNYIENGIKVEATDIVVMHDRENLAEGYAKGRIATVEEMGDVFENSKVDLSNVTVIDWDTIKNDTASFIDDVISQARDIVDVFNLLH